MVTRPFSFARRPGVLSRALLAAAMLGLTSAPLAFAQAAAGTAQAPDLASDLAMMRDELRRLRDEVGTLRAELASMRGAAAPAATAAPPAVTPEALELLQAQIEEHAQTKVESSSRMPVRLFGTILSNTVFNSAEANWLENPNLVAAPPPGAEDSGSMTSTLRQSRLGLNVGTIPVGSLQASGTLIMDFFGGVPNFVTGTVMGMPRLLYAYGRVEGESLALLVGQDHAMLAPRDPTSLAALSFPLFFRSGNLYLRAPQARVEYAPASWTFKTGIVAPIAGDFASGYEFAPAAGAGERSKRPAIEASAGYGRGDAESPAEFAINVSGHHGWRRAVASPLDTTWAGAVDGNVRIGRVGAAGEWFVVDNGEAFGGAVNQGGRAQGGWIEGRLAVSRRASVNGGFGIDRPDDAVGRLLRPENRSAFANTILRLSPELGVSVEYRWLETRLGLVPVQRRNHHVNAVFAVSF